MPTASASLHPLGEWRTRHCCRLWDSRLETETGSGESPSAIPPPPPPTQLWDLCFGICESHVWYFRIRGSGFGMQNSRFGIARMPTRLLWITSSKAAPKPTALRLRSAVSTTCKKGATAHERATVHDCPQLGVCFRSLGQEQAACHGLPRSHAELSREPGGSSFLKIALSKARLLPVCVIGEAFLGCVRPSDRQTQGPPSKSPKGSRF